MTTLKLMFVSIFQYRNYQYHYIGYACVTKLSVLTCIHMAISTL